MDAGIAAIVGASVGAAGTAVAAGLAGFWARAQVKIQVAAQRSHLAQQVRAEYARQLREPRRAAYLEFYTCADGQIDRLSRATLQLTSSSPDTTVIEELLYTRGQVEPLDKAAAAVGLEGPEGVWSAATRTLASIARYRGGLLEWWQLVVEQSNSSTDEEEGKRLDREARDDLDDFRYAAMLVLGTIGTESEDEWFRLRVVHESTSRSTDDAADRPTH
ncbi:hypothetical protein [Streptomyces sp. NPDC005283]|uniref:hypothetical protein n=1 Tax=Streptomyces sp. NPDC005283 TaxID=3156871 RepID=UPI003454FCB8